MLPMLVHTHHQEVKMTDLNSLLYPRHSYQGKAQPETLIFNANLQEFSQRVSYICCLETGGNLSPTESFQHIRSLWHQLKQSYQQLGIEQQSSP